MAAQSFPPFLLTRPALAGARFTAALKDRFGADLRVIVSPLMMPVFLSPDLPSGPFDAIILTSETGAEAARRISAEGQNLPARAFCVGDRTAQVAQGAGFQTMSAKGDADALVALIKTQPIKGRLLHLRGADSRGNLAEKLCSKGIETLEAVVYAQKPCPLTRQARDLLDGQGPVLLPLFSPRSADLLALQRPFIAQLWVAALSVAVAEHTADLKPERLAVAAQPDAESLLLAIHSLCVAGC